MLDLILSGYAMSVEKWLLFIALWIGFAAFPGPNAAYAMLCGSRRGDQAAIAAASGFALGVAAYVVMVGLGLMAFLVASAAFFDVLRWIGVLYLGYLAWQSWFASTDTAIPTTITGQEARSITLKAALITLTNPKSALTYVMVYPLFMTSGAENIVGLAQLIILGATSITLSFFIYSAYGLLAGRLGKLIKTHRQAIIRNRMFALLFAGAGVALAWTSRR